MLRSLYIVATPLHAFSAAEISFQQGKDDECWFLLTSTGSLACASLLERVGGRCAGYRLIDASWCSPNGTTVIPKIFSKALVESRLLGRGRSRLGDIDNVEFANVFFFSPNAMTAYLRYTHPEARFFLAEDGIGTYSGAMEKRAYSLDIRMACAEKGRSQKAVDLMNKVLFGGRLSYKAEALYVHCPEMLEYCFDGEVRRIAPGDGFKQILSECSRPQGDRASYTDYDCIFLGQPISELCAVEPVYELLARIEGSGLKWVYRPHPRERDLPGDIPVEADAGSWELRAMSEIDDSACLLSVCSTAMGIPKMLYGKEPTLIFLHRLVPSHATDGWAGTEKFAASLAAAYSLKERVLVPNTVDELKHLLLRFNNRIVS